MKIFWRDLNGASAIAAILLWAASLPMHAAAADARPKPVTILDYTPAEAEPAQALYDPAVYGNSPAAQEQADRILQAWKTESVTMPWTSLMLQMIAKHKIAPTRGARGSALVHVAMYDAWHLEGDDKARRIAVSTAAAQVLAYWFPSEEHGFDRIIAALVRANPEQAGPASLANGLQLGVQAGRRAIARAESDGAERGWNGVRLEWYGDGRYYGPGAWEPTAPYFYYPPDEPFAPGWQTWVLKSASQFRPTPPAFGSSRFIADLREVVELQETLTPEQRRIAKLWVDGNGSVTPTGHWNQIALDLAKKHNLNEAKTVKLFAVLNIALADTFIAVWDVKYHYWTARPITMAKTVLGVDLKTAILTPPFPSYVSGHAAFSGASARVLGVYFPDDAVYLDALAEQASTSRMFGGIHYRHDNEDGLMLGRTVSNVVLWKMK